MSTEAELVEQCASEAGLTNSEWIRQVVLKAIGSAPETRLLLSEIVALRKIIILLLVDSCEGRALSSERLRYVVDEAEKTKFAMAENRIHSLTNHRNAEVKGNG